MSVSKTIIVNTVIMIDSVREDVSAENGSPPVPMHILRTGGLLCSGAWPTSSACWCWESNLSCKQSHDDLLWTPDNLCFSDFFAMALPLFLNQRQPLCFYNEGSATATFLSLPPFWPGMWSALCYSVISSMVFLLNLVSLDAAVK